MGMSWTTALDDQGKSLESLLARRALEERALMEIAQQAEVQRRNRAAEDLDARQLDESRRWREANQASLDEQRAAAAAENRAQAEAIAAARAEQERILNDPNADPQLKAAIAFKRAGVTPAAGVQTGNDANAMMERVNAANNAAMQRTAAIIAGANYRAGMRQDGIQDDGTKGGGGAASKPGAAREKALEIAEKENELGALPAGMTVADRVEELEAEFSGAPIARAGRGGAAATAPGQDIDLGGGAPAAPAAPKPAKAPGVVQNDTALKAKAVDILRKKGLATDPKSVETFISKNRHLLK